MDYAEKMQKWHEYVEALEEERRKIQVFQRELPLCLQLVTQAIEAYRKELSGTTTTAAQSECSEHTSSDDHHGPVLEEFIPINPTSATYHKEDGEDERLCDKSQININELSSSSSKDKDEKKKSDWLRSVQLWSQPSPDPSPSTLTIEEVPKKAAVTGGLFQPVQRGKSSNTAAAKSGNNNNNNNNNNNSDNDSNNNHVNDSNTHNPSCVVSKAVPSPSVAASSSVETVGSGRGGGGGGGASKKDEKDAPLRKQRRCWSPELHRRFLHALQQLGGSHVATPKRIAELMKVDGITNDEVKSHLQKYRLHTRRPSPTIHNNSNPQAPQFVVVGGIWVAPPEYASVAAAAVPGEQTTLPSTNMIHAPVATITPLPSAIPHTPVAQKSDPKQHLQVSEGQGSHCEGCHVHFNSPAASSSTHATTTSPVY